jgi:hypothetical protein
MERQKHGFTYENYIIEKYNIIKSNGYTNKWDGFLNNIPCSIKTHKLGTGIELADYFRNQEIKEDFYLFVGFWEEEKYNIVEEYCLKIIGDEYSQLFNKDCGIFFQKMITDITNDKKDDLLWKDLMSQGKKLWEISTPNLISPRFKRDHKNQKRIQCAITNKNFYKYFLPKYEVVI